MNSWKENINSYEIYLNLRNEFKHLYSKKLDSIIQMECYNKFGIRVKLRIEKIKNFSKRTPIELIYILCTERIFILKQELLKNTDIILIKSIFDIFFTEEDILFY